MRWAEGAGGGGGGFACGGWGGVRRLVAVVVDVVDGGSWGRWLGAWRGGGWGRWLGAWREGGVGWKVFVTSREGWGGALGVGEGCVRFLIGEDGLLRIFAGMWRGLLERMGRLIG